MAVSQALVLTQDQIQAFTRDGFLRLEGVLSADLLARMRANLDALLDRAPQEAAHNKDFQLEPGTTLHAVRKINNFVRYGDVWWEFVRHPMILVAMRDLLGDDVRLHHTKLMMKPPLEGSAKEWHQDLDSYIDAAERARLLSLGRALRAVDAPLIAAQAYLDDSTPQNGCLEFVPGSHEGGLLPAKGIERFIQPEQVVKLPAQAGDVALFHCLTLHFSAPNQSPHARRGPVAQYYRPPTQVRIRELDAEGFGLRLT
jgi:ectoine hydroxylase-related dioxygenase (phytanoyl-CoA dioxygenase family)